MNELGDLYQEMILDHNKSPRNFREIEGATRVVEGYNPLCGDHYTIYLVVEDDVVRDIAFTGSGCAISKASASVMSSMVKGKTVAEAEDLFQKFHRLITGEVTPEEREELGKLAAFSGVQDYPTRVKCATLSWHTMHTGLTSDKESVTTE